eukprot:SAG31_NODE_39443_length_288_cov_0.814815_1_plen_61_part_01
MSLEHRDSNLLVHMPPLRLGILSAARIAPEAVIFPIQNNADLSAKITVVCVAARDLAKAQA